jgi:hypothetical protein
VRPRGCGGIGRRARFRSVWGQPRGGSSPLIRIAISGGFGGQSVRKPPTAARPKTSQSTTSSRSHMVAMVPCVVCSAAVATHDAARRPREKNTSAAGRQPGKTQGRRPTVAKHAGGRADDCGDVLDAPTRNHLYTVQRLPQDGPGFQVGMNDKTRFNKSGPGCSGRESAAKGKTKPDLFTDCGGRERPASSSYVIGGVSYGVTRAVTHASPNLRQFHVSRFVGLRIFFSENRVVAPVFARAKSTPVGLDASVPYFSPAWHADRIRPASAVRIARGLEGSPPSLLALAAAKPASRAAWARLV